MNMLRAAAMIAAGVSIGSSLVSAQQGNCPVEPYTARTFAEPVSVVENLSSKDVLAKKKTRLARHYFFVPTNGYYLNNHISVG